MQKKYFIYTFFIIISLSVFGKSCLEDYFDSRDFVKSELSSSSHLLDEHKNQDCDFCSHHHHFDFAFLSGVYDFAAVKIPNIILDPSFFSFDQVISHKRPPKFFV